MTRHRQQQKQTQQYSPRRKSPANTLHERVEVETKSVSVLLTIARTSGVSTCTAGCSKHVGERVSNSPQTRVGYAAGVVLISEVIRSVAHRMICLERIDLTINTERINTMRTNITCGAHYIQQYKCTHENTGRDRASTLGSANMRT